MNERVYVEAELLPPDPSTAVEGHVIIEVMHTPGATRPDEQYAARMRVRATSVHREPLCKIETT